MGIDKLMGFLHPILDKLAALDLTSAAAAKRTLDEAFPLGSQVVVALREAFREGLDEGWLCDKQAGSARFSRVAKAGEATRGFSIDAVRLEGPGVWHRHTKGEVDLCFSDGPAARFDGSAEGWVVFGPGSDHVPTTTGGAMNILYFIPNGALEWTREPKG